MAVRILVVEDEARLAKALCDLFADHGHQADRVSTAFAAVESGMSDAYDCIVLDVRLPDGSGFDVVKDLRETGCQTPILMLTVQNDPVDRVRGLNGGADDYLGKPFDPDELIARVHALIRRSSAQSHADELKYGRAVLHRKSRTLTIGERWISLSSKEFMLLEYLFCHPGQVMTRQQLVAHLWGPEAEVAENALDTYVYFLRQKAANIGWRQVIQTVRGQGYCLGPPA